jgi:predicted chitinase
MSIISFIQKNYLNLFLSNKMKNIINEISRIKSLMTLNEDEDIQNKVSGTVIIGDYFAELVSGDIPTLPYLVDKNMTVNSLIKNLSSSETYEEVPNLIVSIGTVDYFKGLNSINLLCDLITEVFPNANLYVFKGVISDFDFENENEIKSVEDAGDIFYDEFEVCGFEIIGDYPIISDVNVDGTNPAVLNLIEYVNEMETGQEKPKVDTLGNKSISDRSVSDEETDFDTIYEFLKQFEKLYKSKMTYDENSKGEFKYDIEQIQITLNFLIGSDLEITGVYDIKTEDAVAKFQSKMGINQTGICDSDTLEEMFYELKVKGFDEEDLSKFIKGEDVEEIIQGILDLSSAGLSSEQRSNVVLLIKMMEDNGITNPYTQVGILSVIGKESGFVPKSEDTYCGSDEDRIIKVFKSRGRKCKSLKCDDEKFFECVYGVDSGASLGNTQPGDGYKYRGRGFNQITGRSNYKKYGYESNPEELNNPEGAADAAIKFLTKGGSLPDFKSKKGATDHFVNVNAGGTADWDESFGNAYEWMDKFEII